MSVIHDETHLIPITTHPNEVSRFTFQDLRDLNDASTSYMSPLSVIALIDMNAFFAQVEQVRLDLSINDPVVCAQWQSLIAVSYAARKYGIGRMDTIKTAKSKCPHVIIAHAAVFKKGESNWHYIDHLPSQNDYKVSLDPYRRESRKIFRLFQMNCDLVEKASVDECYLDFGRSVYQRIMELFPYLKEGNNHNLLPSIPSSLPSSLQWKGQLPNSFEEEKLNESSEIQISPEINDWDDICMLIGSEILFQARKDVYRELGYTTSGGLARNKLLAKLAGGFHKPDNQTIVRTQSINRFLNNFQLNDLTGMGGKTGDHILQRLEVPLDVNSITYLRENFSLKAIQDEFKDDLALSKKIYEIVRGNYNHELTHKVDVKSMMSRKNFTSKFYKLSDAYDWMKVFAGDLYNRLIELDEESLNLSSSQKTSDPVIKRPKTISLHLTTITNVKHSKQAPLIVCRSLEKLKDAMEVAGFRLLNDIYDNYTNLEIKNKGKKIKDMNDIELKNADIIPLINMSMTISNFVKNKDSSLIDSYLSKKNTDIVLINRGDADFKSFNNKYNCKRFNEQDGDYIKKLFSDFEMSEKQANKSLNRNDTYTGIKSALDRNKDNSDISKQAAIDLKENDKKFIVELFDQFKKEKRPSSRTVKSDVNQKYDIIHNLKMSSNSHKRHHNFIDDLLDKRHCDVCDISVEDPYEHNDYHIALDLSSRLNSNEASSSPIHDNSTESSRHNKKQKLERRQSTLPF